MDYENVARWTFASSGSLHGSGHLSWLSGGVVILEKGGRFINYVGILGGSFISDS